MTKEEENGIRITVSNFTSNFPSEYLELSFDICWIIHAICTLLTYYSYSFFITIHYLEMLLFLHMDPSWCISLYS